MFNYCFLILVLLLSDILTKWFVVTYAFPYSYNYGLVLGILGSFGGDFLIIGAVLILSILVFLRKNVEKDVLYKISGAIFFSGALGNVISRFYLGYVIDFLPGGFAGSFFNLADIYLFMGLTGITISQLRGRL